MKVECLMFFVLPALPCCGQADTNALPALAPAYGELPPTFWEQHQYPIILVGVALLAVSVLILRVWLRPATPVILPPEVWARQALGKLSARPEDGNLLSEVSQILRRYVSSALELPAGEMTTAEFCATLVAGGKIKPELVESLSCFLHECDQRKFSPLPAAAPFHGTRRALEFVAAVEAQILRSASVPGAAASKSPMAPDVRQTQPHPDTVAPGNGRAPR